MKNWELITLYLSLVFFYYCIIHLNKRNPINFHHTLLRLFNILSFHYLLRLCVRYIQSSSWLGARMNPWCKQRCIGPFSRNVRHDHGVDAFNRNIKCTNVEKDLLFLFNLYIYRRLLHSVRDQRTGFPLHDHRWAMRV